MHAKANDREGKMASAATTMGVTVIAGAMTTFCSALFMVACQVRRTHPAPTPTLSTDTHLYR